MNDTHKATWDVFIDYFIDKILIPYEQKKKDTEPWMHTKKNDKPSSTS